MRDDLRDRREDTWDLLVVKGLDYGKVTRRLSQQYDVSENAIEKDISRMDEWLPKLDELDLASGTSRMRELRQTRQRLQQMALEARDNNDLEQERKILSEVTDMIEMDVELAQSLGLTEREPEEVEMSWRQMMEQGHEAVDGSPDAEGDTEGDPE